MNQKKKGGGGKAGLASHMIHISCGETKQQQALQHQILP